MWIAGAALVLFLALRWLGPILTPFLVGAILAYLGTPLVDALARRRVPRSVGTLLVVLLFGIAISGLILVLGPLVQSELVTASRRLPDLIALAGARLSPYVEEYLGVSLTFDMASVRELVSSNTEDVRAIAMHVLSGVRTGGTILVSLLVNAALIPVVMFYLLRDWHVIFARFFDLVPRRWAGRTRRIVVAIDGVLAEFLRGQLMVMVVLAIYYAVALTIAGLDHALPIGILTGLLVFIPYVGFGLGLTLGMLAALLQWHGLPAFLGVAAVYGIGQLLENYVLVPYLVGDRIGLHPLAVIFALLAFGQLFGFAGVLLALPVSAALLVGLRELRQSYVASPLYRED
ncbi:MAG: AI-2E family transporter [Proteobacteria bacterium]|nr:AI-2E family transporter [Pseudomonadota bacterium]